jgi:hypothetical protein
MYDSSSGLQGGFTLSEYERQTLNDLKKTDPVPKHEFRRLQVLRETKLIDAVDLEPLYTRYVKVLQKIFKVRFHHVFWRLITGQILTISTSVVTTLTFPPTLHSLFLISQVPVATLVLIDLETVYFKARAGLEGGTAKGPRKGALCNGILLESAPLVCATADVHRDIRFSHIPSFAWPEGMSTTSTTNTKSNSNTTTNSTTNTTTDNTASSDSTHAKNIHFYASVALVVNSVRIGSLCMIDTQPRPDIVDKAVRLLPDFGHIISDCLCRRHEAQLGCSTELSELCMSVVYNLKYPMVNLQKSFDSLGQCVAFQPSLRATRLPVYEGSGSGSSSGGHNSPVPTAGTNSSSSAASTTNTSSYANTYTTQGTSATSTRSIVCIPEESSSSSSSAQPMSPASVTSNHAFSPVSGSGSGSSSGGSSKNSKNMFSMKYDNATPVNTITTTDTANTTTNTTDKTSTITNTNTTTNTATNTTTTTPTRNTTPVPVRYQKVTNFDALRVEKDTLVDLLHEVRHRTMTLIKLLAHSLSIAHDLQAQYHKQAEAAVSTSYTVNNTITSIAGKRSTDEASRERIYPIGKMNSRLHRIHTNYTQSALNKNELSFTVDPVLSCTADDTDAVKFQCNSRALTLCMFTTMYHLCKVHPGSKIDVNMRFEERDYTPLHVQLANRVSSPGGNRQYIHGGMHRLNSPTSTKTSTKSIMDSGKLTRIPSFANTNLNFATTLSGSSDGSISESQQREILLLHSRRSSIEDAIYNLHNTTTNATNTTSNVHTHSVHTTHTTHGAGVSSDKLYTVPAPINTNLGTNNTNLNTSTTMNNTLNPNYFTSPRSSLRKNSNSKASQICGDIYITFKVAIKSGSVHGLPTFTPTRADSIAKSDFSDYIGPKSDHLMSDSDESGPKVDHFSFDSRVETDTFENVVLRNILSTVQGGFGSSTGSEFYPDPPNPVLTSLMVFGAGGIRSSGMTDTMNSLPNSLKIQPHEVLNGIREDVSEGEYYILTIRIPCNAYTNTTNTATSTEEKGHEKKLSTLTPIQSLRNFGSSSSTFMNSSSTSTRFRTESNVSVIDGEGSPVPANALPSLFSTNNSKFSTIKFKPSISIFSPRHIDHDEDHDETAELPLRHKDSPTNTNSTLYNNTNTVKAKPKATRSFSRSMTAMFSSVTHRMFGTTVAPVDNSSSSSGAGSVSIRSGTSATTGFASSNGRSMRRVGDIRVTPTNG